MVHFPIVRVELIFFNSSSLVVSSLDVFSGCELADVETLRRLVADARSRHRGADVPRIPEYDNMYVIGMRITLFEVNRV